jgi:hypothetical protein
MQNSAGFAKDVNKRDLINGIAIIPWIEAKHVGLAKIVSSTASSSRESLARALPPRVPRRLQ